MLGLPIAGRTVFRTECDDGHREEPGAKPDSFRRADITPIYEHEERQSVAVQATGHARFETTPGDYLKVYAPPD